MKSKKPILILMVAAFGAFLGTFTETFLIIALTPIMHDFNVGVSTVQWLTTAYMLGAAIMIPVASFLYRKFATRPLFLFTVGLLITGSLVCAFAPSFPVMLAGRIIQSLGTGMLTPIGMNMVLSVVPKEKMGSYMGLMGAATTLGPSLSIIVAGILLNFSTWHILFFVFAALMVILFIMGAVIIGKDQKLENPHLDILSVILISLALIGILYGISTLFSGNIFIALASIIIGIISLLVFAKRQKKLALPFINFEPLKAKEFKIGISLNLIAMFILLSLNVIMPLFIQNAMGVSSLQASLTLFPSIVVSCILAPIAGKIYDKKGGSLIVPLGYLLVFVFILLLGLTIDLNSLLLIALLYIPIAGSMSLIIGPSQTFALSSLSREQNPHGVTLVTAGFQIAGCIGTSLFTGVYSLMTDLKLEANSTPYEAMEFAFIITLALAFIVALVGFVLALSIRRFEKNKPVVMHMSLRNIMKTDVYKVKETDNLLTALTLINDKHISGVPVVNKSGHLTGFISDGDIMRYLSKAHPLFVNAYSLALLGAESNFDEKLQELMTLKVKDIAKKKVLTIDINTSLEDVCKVLESKHLKKAPVMDNGKMVGIINRSNITHYAIESYLAAIK